MEQGGEGEGVAGNDSYRPDGVCVLKARQMTAKVESGRTVEQVLARYF